MRPAWGPNLDSTPVLYRELGAPWQWCLFHAQQTNPRHKGRHRAAGSLGLSEEPRLLGSRGWRAQDRSQTLRGWWEMSRTRAGGHTTTYVQVVGLRVTMGPQAWGTPQPGLGIEEVPQGPIGSPTHSGTPVTLRPQEFCHVLEGPGLTGSTATQTLWECVCMLVCIWNAYMCAHEHVQHACVHICLICAHECLHDMHVCTCVLCMTRQCQWKPPGFQHFLLSPVWQESSF